MIKFEGLLTGNAETFFIKKMLNRGSFLLSVFLAFTLPVWGVLSFKVGAFVEVMTFFGVSILLSPLIFRLCLTKKQRRKNLINKVIIDTDNGVIKTVSDESVTKNKVTQVKAVYDYGDFYYIVFPCKYVASICVCQKDFLSKGTIKNFEFLFLDKIIKKEPISGKS